MYIAQLSSTHYLCIIIDLIPKFLFSFSIHRRKCSYQFRTALPSALGAFRTIRLSHYHLSRIYAIHENVSLTLHYVV